VLDTLRHLERLTSYGVNYRSFTEQYLDSTGIFKEAVIGILAAVAKQERVRLSERVKAGLERAVASGRKLGRTPVASTVKALQVRRLRSEGKSIRAIAHEVRIAPNTVVSILKEERS
jgi:DNA invertase Pin-like site-specific DNA recombinase